MTMSLFPDTPKTLLDELALDKVLDEAKWRQFDEMYRPVVAAFIVQRFPAVAYEAEDIAQETMIRLSAAIRERRYEAARGKFRTFLGAIANNLVVDILRRNSRYENLPLDEVDWISSYSFDHPAFALLDRQWKEAVYRAARRHVLHHIPMPPFYADVWRALEKGEASADIAARLGVTPAFVRQAKHRVSDLIAATVATYDPS